MLLAVITVTSTKCDTPSPTRASTTLRVLPLHADELHAADMFYQKVYTIVCEFTCRHFKCRASAFLAGRSDLRDDTDVLPCHLSGRLYRRRAGTSIRTLANGPEQPPAAAVSRVLASCRISCAARPSWPSRASVEDFTLPASFEFEPSTIMTRSQRPSVSGRGHHACHISSALRHQLPIDSTLALRASGYESPAPHVLPDRALWRRLPVVSYHPELPCNVREMYGPSPRSIQSLWTLPRPIGCTGRLGRATIASIRSRRTDLHMSRPQ